MSILGPLTRDMSMETVRWHNLGEARCFSGGSYVAPPLSASCSLAYPMSFPEPTITRRLEYAFVARCKNCHREYHLDPNTPIPPVYCGLGTTHGCGSSEWHVFKRLIEVEPDPEYVDDCIYSDTRVTKQHRLVGAYVEPGCLTLPSMTRKEVSVFRKKWKQMIHRVSEGSFLDFGAAHED